MIELYLASLVPLDPCARCGYLIGEWCGGADLSMATCSHFSQTW